MSLIPRYASDSEMNLTDWLPGTNRRICVKHHAGPTAPQEDGRTSVEADVGGPAGRGSLASTQTTSTGRANDWQRPSRACCFVRRVGVSPPGASLSWALKVQTRNGRLAPIQGGCPIQLSSRRRHRTWSRRSQRRRSSLGSFVGRRFGIGSGSNCAFDGRPVSSL